MEQATKEQFQQALEDNLNSEGLLDIFKQNPDLFEEFLHNDIIDEYGHDVDDISTIDYELIVTKLNSDSIVDEYYDHYLETELSLENYVQDIRFVADIIMHRLLEFEVRFLTDPTELE